MVKKTDQYGNEYDTEAGSPEPLERGDTHPRTGKEIKYDPCNAVLKYTWERYDEVRYCTGLAVGNFGDAANYEHDQFCKHHQGRKYLMDQQEENFKTGAFAKSYEHVFQYLEPHNQIMAVELLKSLMGESRYSFEPEDVVLEVDVSDSGMAEQDVLHVDFPIPTEKVVRGQALWYAALDFVKMQNISEEQFRVSAEETDMDGRSLAVGEKTFETETESGEVMEIVDEHHLNLPLSRIQSDYEQHLKFGGVSIEDDGDEGSVDEREWVITVDSPEDSSVKPEAEQGTSPFAELDVPDE